MAQRVQELFQPIWSGVQLLSITTASATATTVLTTCGAVRIGSGGAPLYFNFTGSASVSGSGVMLLAANSSIILETQGAHTISFMCPTSANPMQVSVTPLSNAG